MAPVETTRERLRGTLASLLVFFAAQVLKWQEPVSAAGDTIWQLASGFKKIFPFPQTPSSSGNR